MKWGAWVIAAVVLATGCAHSRREPVRAGILVIAEDGPGVGGAGHDCDAELEACFTRCWESPRPPYPHVERSEWYYEYCTRECRQQYTDCLREQEQQDAERAKKPPAHEFSSVEQARAWIRAHRAEVALGSVVVVAGVAFILATSGAGALILVPLAL